MGRKKKTEQVESRAYDDTIYVASNPTTSFSHLTRSFGWQRLMGSINWIDDLTITANIGYNWLRVGYKIYMKINEQPLNGSYVCTYKFHAFNSWYLYKGENWYHNYILERVPHNITTSYIHQYQGELIKEITYDYIWRTILFPSKFNITTDLPPKTYFVFSTESGYRFYPLMARGNKTINTNFGSSGASWNFQYAIAPETANQVANVASKIYQVDNSTQIGSTSVTNTTTSAYTPLEGTSLNFDGKDIGWFSANDINNARWIRKFNSVAGFPTFKTFTWVELTIGGKTISTDTAIDDNTKKFVLSWNTANKYTSNFDNNWQTLNQMVNSYNYSNKFIGWYLGPGMRCFNESDIKIQTVNIQTSSDNNNNNLATLLYLDIPITGYPITATFPQPPSILGSADIGAMYTSYINPKTPVTKFPPSGTYYLIFNGGFYLVNPYTDGSYNKVDQVWHFGGQLPVLTSEYAKFVGQNMNSTQANLQNARLSMTTSFIDGVLGTAGGVVVGSGFGAPGLGALGGLLTGIGGAVKAGVNIQKTKNMEGGKYKDALNASKMNLTDVTTYDTLIYIINLSTGGSDSGVRILERSPSSTNSIEEYIKVNGLPWTIVFTSGGTVEGYWRFKQNGLIKKLMVDNNSTFTYTQIEDLTEVLINGVYT